MKAEPLDLADTHCHLMLPAFAKDCEEVVERARATGVTRLLVPALDLLSSHQAIKLAERYPEVFAAVGVHPHNASTWDPSVATELRNLALSSHVVAIGEIGLDFYRNLSTPSQQKTAFQAQLELAADLGLPVVIHNRQATDDVVVRLLQWSQNLPANLVGKAGVLHAFSADPEAARLTTEAGFYLGVAGPITYPNTNAWQQIIAQIPIERMLLETDAPYLTPHPFRNMRNEPAHVKLVAEGFAKVMGVSTSKAAKATWQNASNLFGWNHGNDNRYFL
ncbi:MAG: YchF/TatD family DNA exonuclease [Anaerolineales bacterium]|nr:YchF/TatD family DNA exonuclease [Anaerolineales bacterium]